VRGHPRAFFNNQRPFFNPQFSIHPKEAPAQSTIVAAAKLDLITTSFAGQELWSRRLKIGQVEQRRDGWADEPGVVPPTTKAPASPEGAR
jgi:hypothetical protein